MQLYAYAPEGRSERERDRRSVYSLNTQGGRRRIEREEERKREEELGAMPLCSVDTGKEL